MRTLIVGLLLVFFAYPTPVWADSVNDCTKRAGDILIRGCSQIIKSRKLYGTPISKKNLAVAYINRGSAYHNMRQYDLAILDFTKAIKLNPKVTGAYFNRGGSYQLKRQYDLAILDYNKVIKLNPKHMRALIHRETAYKAKKRLAVAVRDKKPKNVSNSRPGGAPNVAYANRHGNCNSKFYDRVIKGCTLIIRSNGESQNSRAVAYYKRGLAYYRGKNAYSGNIKKKPSKKIENMNFETLKQTYSGSSGSSLPIAGAFDRLMKRKSGPDHSKPIADFTKAIKLNEDYTHAYFARGVAYQKFRDSRAVADFTKVLELNPNYPGARSNLSRAKSTQKIKEIFASVPKKPSSKKQKQRVQKAKIPRAPQKLPAQKHTSKEAEAFKNQGNVYFAKGDYLRAIALYTKAIQVDQNYAPAYNNRGRSYGRIGKYAPGIADLTKALALNPSTADVYYYNRAQIYREKGDFRRAIADYTTAHELDPKDIATLVYRGKSYLWAQRSRLAIKDFHRLMALRPKAAYYRYLFGTGIYYAGKTEKAMSVWKKACKLAPEKQTRYWQRRLKKFGHYSGAIDGVCDFGMTIAFASCAESKCKL